MFCVEIKPGWGAAGGWGLGALLPLRPLPRPYQAMCEWPSAATATRAVVTGPPASSSLERLECWARCYLPARRREPVGSRGLFSHGCRRRPAWETPGSPLGFAENRVMEDPGCLWHFGVQPSVQASVPHQGAGGQPSWPREPHIPAGGKERQEDPRAGEYPGQFWERQ